MKPRSILHWKLLRSDSLEFRMLRSLASVLIVLILAVNVIYYINLRIQYSSQLKRTNDNLVHQVAISYETILKNVTDAIYKVPLYDEDMISLVNQYGSRSDSSYKCLLYDKLDSIVLGNQYLYSAYLYFPSDDLVYDSNTGSVYPIGSFADRTLFQGRDLGRIYVTDPRLVSSQSESMLLSSVVTPIPLNSEPVAAVMAVNINAGQLYRDILKNINTENDVNLIVYNSAQQIVISKDKKLLFQKYRPSLLQSTSYGTTITSGYYSESLHWHFVLQTTIRSKYGYSTQLFVFAGILILFLMIGLIVIFLLVRRFSRPMDRILSEYHNGVWREFLTGERTDGAAVGRQLAGEGIDPRNCDGALLLFRNTRPEYSLCQRLILAVKEAIGESPLGARARMVLIDRSQVALALVWSGHPPASDAELARLAVTVHGQLEADLQETVYIGVSQMRTGAESLPVSFRDAAECLNYRIVTGLRVIAFSAVQERSAHYDYPYDVEKQLVNNILAGNREASQKLVTRFFDCFTGPELSIQDGEICNVVYQLETAVIRGISSLPIPVRVERDGRIAAMPDIPSIRAAFADFVDRIVQEINGQSRTNFSVGKIFDHIEAHFQDNDFNLNIAADELHLNRNYLAKVVKENTGTNFIDYVNLKRIEVAKRLIRAGNCSIEETAHRVGFNYAHYFIKVFKGFEGVTPGQFRDRCRQSGPSA